MACHALINWATESPGNSVAEFKCLRGTNLQHCCHAFKSVINSKFCCGEGELRVWKPFAYPITCWKGCMSYATSYNFRTITWKRSTWSRSFLVSSPDLTQEERVWRCSANPSGFINDYFLGRIFRPPITLQKIPFVIATLETLGYFSTMTAIFQHWKNELSILHCKLWIFIKPEISAKCQLMGGVLVGDNLRNLMVDHTLYFSLQTGMQAPI